MLVRSAVELLAVARESRSAVGNVRLELPLCGARLLLTWVRVRVRTAVVVVRRGSRTREDWRVLAATTADTKLAGEHEAKSPPESLVESTGAHLGID